MDCCNIIETLYNVGSDRKLIGSSPIRAVRNCTLWTKSVREMIPLLALMYHLFGRIVRCNSLAFKDKYQNGKFIAMQ
jgi:hypothetical protein